MYDVGKWACTRNVMYVGMCGPFFFFFFFSPVGERYVC